MEEWEASLERREFLKKAGVTSAALASFPFLAEAAWADDDDDNGRRTKFYFVALSGVAATVTGGDAVVMAGCGSFRPGEGIRGGGEFVHFDGTSFGSPDNVIRTGRWKATRLLSFKLIGTWGVGVAGILRMRARLIPCEGRVIRGARIMVVCNLSPASIITDPFQQEGYTLTLPNGVTFSPFTPNIGLTLFTRRCNERNGD